MKKIFILLLMVIASVSVIAQTSNRKKTKKKTRTHVVHKKHKKTGDSVATGTRTIEKTRGLDKGSEQGKTMKQTHRSERSQDGIIVETPDGPIVTGGIKPVKGTKQETGNGKMSGKSSKYSYRKRTLVIGDTTTTENDQD